jgi:hypothetical protein
MADSALVYRNDWRTSPAKKLLQGMVERKEVTEADDVNYVRGLHDDFKNYDPKKFKTNLRNLIQSILKRDSTNAALPAAVLNLRQPTTEVTDKVYLQNWRSSNAKQVLLRLIKEGKVTETSHTEKEVYDMCNGLFHNYKIENFKTNLRNLLKSVLTSHEASQFDKEALAKDRELVGP